MDKNAKIHNGHWERTRERILKSPKVELTEIDVLEGLLQLIFTRADTNEIARNLLYRYHNIVQIAKATPEELENIDGLGKVASQKLAMLFKGIDFIKSAEMDISYKSPVNVTNAVEMVMQNYEFGPKEKLQAFYLDENNIILGRPIITEGDISQVGMDYQTIIDYAQRYEATKLIIAHNHPSDNIMPSKEDYLCTAKLYSLLRAIGTRLVDHIIISENKYFSFYYSKILPLICEQYEQMIAHSLHTQNKKENTA